MGVLLENKESIKKLFPNLAKELEGGESKIRIDSVRANAAEAEAEDAELTEDEVLLEQAENALPDKFRHYNPTVVDFIRRCDTQSQAEEIVAYLQKRGEITAEYAAEILAQLKKDGLRSFGCKKDSDYYFKESGFCNP
jgi:hypothetical protein